MKHVYRTASTKKRDKITTDIFFYDLQVLQPSYGLYVWPSAPVLAQYVWHHRDRVKGRRILEVKM